MACQTRPSTRFFVCRPEMRISPPYPRTNSAAIVPTLINTTITYGTLRKMQIAIMEGGGFIKCCTGRGGLTIYDTRLPGAQILTNNGHNSQLTGNLERINTQQQSMQQLMKWKYCSSI